jgi:hypothetical protein
VIELEKLEALALSADRDDALAGLLPGTVEHDYWRGVRLQHQGRLDEVDQILAAWQARHGGTGEDHERLARRQLLIRAGQDLAAHADRIRLEAGEDLDDEPEAAAAAQRHPTRLDPSLIDELRLVDEAISRSHDLGHVTDWALGDLLSRSLDGARRRHLLQRLVRANRPEVVALIAADLDEKSSRGFGSLPVHARLTRAQLDELARLRPELRVNPAWVAAVLIRLSPPSHVDWQTDLAARDAALAVLWAAVGGLAASFNQLKAQVLYHQLDLDRRLGRADRERFLRYLALPRQADYARTERLRGVPAEQQVAPGAEGVPGLEPVDDDEALVAEYLEQFLLREDGAAFAEWLRADWLEERLATARLLAGAADADRWVALLGPARLAELRDRVDIELTVQNPTRFPAGAPVALEVDLKNVPRLLVKTFRIDPVAYFLASRGAEVDTSIDLDGMVASDERVVPCDAPAIRRVRQRIDLPGCARPGTYVVELIGNGISSRALIRKGALRYSLRVGVAGPVVRVLDEAGRPAAGARIWLGGREYAPREDGAISIPFSTTPGPVPMLLVHGGVAQREVLQHPAERYHFSAGLHLERESLVPDRTARALLRPILTVAGWPAPLALIQEARVEIAVTDRAGTTSSRTQPIELGDGAETVVELQVPAEVASIALTVRGRIRVASTQQTIDVADGVRADIGAIHDNPHTESLHLARTDRGTLLQLLGKSGEPRAGRSIPVSLKHAAVGFEVSTTLETDAEGRIELGALEGIERITATAAVQQSWNLWPDREPARTVHALAGAPVRLPRPPGVSERDPAASLALIELRGGQPASDATARVSIAGRTLVIDDLEPGDYLLQARGGAEVRLAIAPAGSPVADGWALTPTTSLELSPPAPLLESLATSGDHVAIRIAGAGPATRVHLIATRFLPEKALPRTLAREPRTPVSARVPPVVSHYLSGRDIGDEYRYLLERRTHPRRPGVLLDKPGLLLNPWAIRTTSTGVQHAREGKAYATSAARGAAAPPPAAPRPAAKPGPAEGGYTAVDFLPSAAVLLANLRPDPKGELRVPLADLGDAQSVRVLVVDPAMTRSADLPLAERPLRPRDLRLRLALDPDGHFVEVRRAEPAPAGARLVVEDVRSGKLELVDTTARAHQILLSLGAPDQVRELGFLARWHSLDEAARRDRYARFACHEVHLFLYFRDRAFFDRVIGPYLADKRDKTFLDRWLLDEPLDRYLEPWAFGRLNALERVLLARRLGERGDGIARLLGDAVDLIPPDPERDARLVDTLLGQAALEASGIAEAAKDAREAAPSAEKAKAKTVRLAAPMAAPAMPAQTMAPGGGFAADGYGGDHDEAANLAPLPRRRQDPGVGGVELVAGAPGRRHRRADPDQPLLARSGPPRSGLRPVPVPIPRRLHREHRRGPRRPRRPRPAVRRRHARHLGRGVAPHRHLRQPRPGRPHRHRRGRRERGPLADPGRAELFPRRRPLGVGRRRAAREVRDR